MRNSRSVSYDSLLTILLVPNIKQVCQLAHSYKTTVLWSAGGLCGGAWSFVLFQVPDS